MKKLNFWLLFSTFLVIQSCKSKNNTSVYALQKVAVVDSMAVVTAHPEASRIAFEILQEGGNAIDAAIASQFALAVCYPVAGNIGGGGFMLYRDPNGSISTLDFREKAPRSATQNMFLDSLSNVIEEASTLGGLAVGVPGSVAGMEAAFTKGSVLKNWPRLVQPAVELAETGFHLTAQQAENLNSAQKRFRKANKSSTVFIAEHSFQAGDLFVQKDLAETLKNIQQNGADGFYKGKVAEQIVESVKIRGGILSLEDLQSYEVVWREPIEFPYKNYTIYSMPPPSSGGIVLAQLFNAIEPYPLEKWGFQDFRSVHLMVEAEKRAFADRAVHLGDPDFYDVPQAELISKEYTKARMESYDPDRASVPESIKEGIVESEETTHLSILDRWGGAVSLTTTLNTGYGSKVVVDGAGFLLNNEMDDFSVKLGEPNFYGLVGAEANKIEPEKRMLSSMTPTIVEKDGKLFMVLGTPGGSTIITSVYQTIVNVIEHRMSPEDAVHSCRFHHQWKPEFIFTEENCLADETRTRLESMGHQLENRGSIGRVEAIVIQNGKITAVADNRGDDDARGQ